MPCHTRMKTIFSQGVLWLCLLNFGLVLCVIEPGYLDFDNLPDTNFSCVGKVIGGYYADLETSCQMFHVCTIGQLDEPMDIRFLCLNGTVFDQETRVCERVDEVDCSKSERFYHLNLELYGNTAPPLLEDPGNTEAPIISSTTSTTTPKPTSTVRTSRGTFFTTPGPTLAPPTHSTPKVITSNQFPVNRGPDIRFNPEEINIRLTPGSPPIIKTPSVSFQQQNFNGDSRITVTTHTNIYKDVTTQKSVTTTQKPKSVVSYGLNHGNKHSFPQSYDYSYQNTESSDVDYHTDLPSSEYTDLGFDGHMNFESTNQKKQQIFPSTTKRIENKPFVSSTPFSSSVKPQITFLRTEKPPNVQLPLPLFPTFPPLTFSSPAPFTLTRHIETKRSNDHQRPRIVVSASASVSDASGRRLNYSLGTIGQHILGKAPQSYDEYKEADVGLDPFYHDVPKVTNKSRKKRNTEEEDNTAKEETSIEETTHWIPPDYVDDNYEPLTYNNNTEVTTKIPEMETEKEYEYDYEYIDDNYEPSIYDNNETVTTTEFMRDTTELPTTTEIFTTTTDKQVETTTNFQDEFEITTIQPETTTNEEQRRTTISSESLQHIITTTAPEQPETTTNEEHRTTTISLENLQHIITTTAPEQPETTTNDEQRTTTISSESLQHIITTTAPVTTEIFETTTEMPETTLNLDNLETTTLMLETTTEQTTGMPTTTEDVKQTTVITTTEMPTTSSTTRYQYLKTREPAYKRFSRTRPTPRHRFSSPTIQMSKSVLKLRANKFANPSSRTFTSSEEIASEVISHRLNKIVPESKHYSTSSTLSEEVPLTDSPLSKSANPTEPKIAKNPSTTPITKTFFIPRRFTYDVMKSFNCFGRQLNKFYEDPRDCRLFHYCTPGYTESQVLDMKFVCDYGTYFDSEKLICTKVKPGRCK